MQKVEFHQPEQRKAFHDWTRDNGELLNRGYIMGSEKLVEKYLVDEEEVFVLCDGYPYFAEEYASMSDKNLESLKAFSGDIFEDRTFTGVHGKGAREAYRDWAREERVFTGTGTDLSFRQLAQRHSQDPDTARRIVEGMHEKDAHIAKERAKLYDPETNDVREVFRRVERVMEEVDRIADQELNSFPGQEEAMQ